MVFSCLGRDVYRFYTIIMISLLVHEHESFSEQSGAIFETAFPLMVGQTDGKPELGTILQNLQSLKLIIH